MKIFFIKLKVFFLLKVVNLFEVLCGRNITKILFIKKKEEK
jgi:hypothetical protein